MPSLVSCGPFESDSLESKKASSKGEYVELEVVAGIGTGFVPITLKSTSLFGKTANPNLETIGQGAILRKPMANSIGVKQGSVRMHKRANDGTLKCKRSN